ncbi:RusA family crossover junction endodeoxyribonuclease [Dehalobacter sp. MCB1]|uniref:RusA family crossover junction endodeoxyribonuclease n=1 Tax=Dehalobacter sp. MCB1 TaxID=1844756 RepID=UPI000E6CC12B|nr:RusA family crossover junction endodeoxyribonuclease [Dehalobacter sp. MCB1]
MAKSKVIDENDLFRDKPQYSNKKLKISLPVPPSVNHMYYNTRNGGKRLTPTAENYIRVSRALINEAIEVQRWLRQKDSTWFYCDLVFYFGDRRIRDASNCLKLLLDVMQGIVYKNDYYCLPRIQSVEYDKENPRVEVCITTQSKNDRIKAINMQK